MKHNGINYTETQHGVVIVFDGGAMGGKIKKTAERKISGRMVGRA